MSQQSSDADNKFMQIALSEAEKAYNMGETPIGAVVVMDNQVIAAAHNLTETLGDFTAHAELLALQKAAKSLKCKYLDKCSIYVTLEPCQMCLKAITLSRISNLFYGTNRRKEKDCRTVTITDNIMQKECAAILTNFYTNIRNKNKTQTGDQSN